VCSAKNNLQIRQVGPESAEALVAIHAEGFANYWNISDFNDFFSIPCTLAWLAETPEGEPVAMMVLRIVEEQADVITIAVTPQWRNQGLAHALMIKSIERAKQLGAKALFLDVEDGNIPALRLYEGLGFSHINRRKLYYRQKDGSYTDALVMTRKLA
jgi:ribosomal-protein-alanine N-acetyltransferase